MSKLPSWPILDATVEDHTYWYLTRAAGLLAYLLLFASVVLGLLMTTDFVGRRFPRFRAYDLHRFLALLALGATLFHALIVAPGRLHRLLRARPDAAVRIALPAGLHDCRYLRLVADGAVHRDLLPAAAGLVRGLAPAALRDLHRLCLALAHGAGAGTDTQQVWARDLYAVTGFVVFDLVVVRVLRGSARGVPHTREAPGTPPTLAEG